MKNLFLGTCAIAAVLTIAGSAFAQAKCAGSYCVRQIEPKLESGCLTEAQMFEGDVETARAEPRAWGMTKVSSWPAIAKACKPAEVENILTKLGLTSDERAKLK